MILSQKKTDLFLNSENLNKLDQVTSKIGNPMVNSCSVLVNVSQTDEQNIMNIPLNVNLNVPTNVPLDVHMIEEEEDEICDEKVKESEIKLNESIAKINLEFVEVR